MYVTDYSKFAGATGWRPEIAPAVALKKMYDWWKRNRALFAKPEPEVAALARLEALPRTA